MEFPDHIYIDFNFKKTTDHAAHEPVVLNIISKYLSDNKFEITHNHDGKPSIKTSNNIKIYLSISHSQQCLVLALSRTCDLGIDIEFIQERKNRTAIARRYFSESEQNQTLLDFYKSWTAREAFIKTMSGRLFKQLSKIYFNKTNIGLNNTATHNILSKVLDNNYVLSICRALTTTKNLVFFQVDSNRQ